MSDLKWKSLEDLKKERENLTKHIEQLDLESSSLAGRIGNLKTKLHWIDKYIADKSPKPEIPEEPVKDTKLLEFKASKILRRIDFPWEHLRDIIDSVDGSNAYLAGGALRGGFVKEDQDDEVKDFDIFFKNEADCLKFEKKLLGLDYTEIFRCPENKLVTYSLATDEDCFIKVQCIKEFYYPDLKTCIDTFDIFACVIGYSMGKVYTYRNAIRAIRRKKITFNQVMFPVATLGRILKYSKKGYSFFGADKQDFVERIHQKGIDGEDINTRIYID